MTGFRCSRVGQEIIHLFFANDSMMFTRALEKNCRPVKKVLDCYANASGQNKNELFASIRNRVWERVKGWISKLSKLFSVGGKEVLLQAVAQSIPTYSMSLFRLPKSLVTNLHRICATFWLGSDEERRKIHWGSWSNLCKRIFWVLMRWNFCVWWFGEPSFVEWRPSDVGFYKINTDVAIDVVQKSVVTGAIIRDCNGRVISSCAQVLSASYTPLLTEALTILWDLQFARESELVANDSRSSVSFNPMKANMDAHCLAKLSLNLDFDNFWMEDVPLSVAPIVLGDYPRLM
ncbi:hypothetical protein Ddye_029843 [Dipteronia dyeriana]|uniref:RNase H type-1 domain-containing protein n=1 Tax=Dipteronia dyeriana TaxID=168575 RepID=A0AAD9TFJ4_9ROSI|nr:hypothetical protein Ddye_029843 [Dipteronia dyeriana]